MTHYKKHSIFCIPGKEKSFARIFIFSRYYSGFFAILPPLRG